MVMLSVRKAWFACAMTLPACSGAIGDVEPGTLALQLKPAAAVQLSLLKYTVSHERGFVRSGPVAIGEQQTFTFNVDALPPAYGYVVSAYAEGTITKEKTKTVCTGQASFEIRTAQSTGVSMTLQCDGVARTGTGNGSSLNNCPIVGVISAAPAEAPVGQDVQLRAELPADSDGPLPIAYQWHAASGLLSAPSAAKTRFLCNKPGVVEVQLTVSDGDQACDEAPASVYVTCTDDSCINLTHCANSPVQQPTSAPSKAVAGRSGTPAGAAGVGSTTSITHTAPNPTSGAGGAGASTGTITKTLKDAGTPATIDAALPWDAGSWDWPDPNDSTPPREQRRRERPAAGSSGQSQAGSGGAGAISGAAGSVVEPAAGNGGEAPQPDAGTVGDGDGDGDEVDAGLIDRNHAMNAAPGTRAGAYSET